MGSWVRIEAEFKDEDQAQSVATSLKALGAKEIEMARIDRDDGDSLFIVPAVNQLGSSSLTTATGSFPNGGFIRTAGSDAREQHYSLNAKVLEKDYEEACDLIQAADGEQIQ